MNEKTMPESDKTQTSLKVHDVAVIYPNGNRAIYDVSFSLLGGTTCALVGVNGSGKSTLFNAIMGIIDTKNGAVTINGLSVKQALKQNGVAYVPQSESIDWFFPILVYDVVMLGRYGYLGMRRVPTERDHQHVREAMERLGISHLAKRQIGELSGGQKKRVFLARSLAQQSRVILLDEPFTGVDIKTEDAIMDLLRELRSDGYLMLVSTHNLGSVPEYCNEVVLLNQTTIASGSTENTYTRENLEKTFGGVLKNIFLPAGAKAENVTIISDDERPVVFIGAHKNSAAMRENKSDRS